MVPKKDRVLKLELVSCPLKISFPNLFNIASHPDIEVAKAFVNGEWHLEFRRQLSANLIVEWSQLMDLLEGVELAEGRDEVVWLLEKSQKYSTSSLYKLMTSRGC